MQLRSWQVPSATMLSKEKLFSAQRGAALRIVSAYRTVLPNKQVFARAKEAIHKEGRRRLVEVAW